MPESDHVEQIQSYLEKIKSFLERTGLKKQLQHKQTTYGKNFICIFFLLIFKT